MSLFEVTKKRPENFEKLYHALLTIKPTLVENRKSFFTHGTICHKIEK